MERLRLGLLNLKEDGNGISIGDRLHGSDGCRLKNSFVVPFISFPEKMFMSWEILLNFASQNTFLSKTHIVGQAVLEQVLS